MRRADHCTSIVSTCILHTHWSIVKDEAHCDSLSPLHKPRIVDKAHVKLCIIPTRRPQQRHSNRQSVPRRQRSGSRDAFLRHMGSRAESCGSPSSPTLLHRSPTRFEFFIKGITRRASGTSTRPFAREREPITKTERARTKWQEVMPFRPFPL